MVDKRELKDTSAFTSTLDVVPLRHCGRDGCNRFASVALALKVPFAGKSPKDAEPLTLFLGVEVCEDCKRGAKAEQFITDKFRAGMVKAIIEAGRPPVDFTRCLLAGVALTDQAYIGYRALMAKAGTAAKSEAKQ